MLDTEGEPDSDGQRNATANKGAAGKTGSIEGGGNSGGSSAAEQMSVSMKQVMRLVYKALICAFVSNERNEVYVARQKVGERCRSGCRSGVQEWVR